MHPGFDDQERLQLVQRRSRLSASSDPSQRARILLADDHELTRVGLRMVLAQDATLEVVGEARDGLEAVELAQKLQPDLVLMDLFMPKMDGLEAMRALKHSNPMTPVLILSMYEDVDMLLETVKAGAAGYVLKTANEARLRAAVREALAGDLPVDQRMTREVLRRMAADRKTPPTAPPSDLLTTREREVLSLIARGSTNPEIARELIITKHTVKVHVEHILAKLGVSDRTQAAVRAIELGYVPSVGAH
jgi:DNA-binding NarL/FixJ family response regulator